MYNVMYMHYAALVHLDCQLLLETKVCDNHV